MDDLLIWGATREELLQRLRRVLDKARQIGIKFSKDKIGKILTEVEYIGNVLSEKGIQIAQRRIQAIQALQSPKSKKDLQSFLGLVTYLTKFLKDSSCKTAYLRSLLSNKTEWLWDEQAEADFNCLKKLISEAPILAFFDPSKDITISVDASGYGMGAVLLQENKPIAYASTSLTPTQERYASIERELLAIIFGLEHFHHYVYGQHITVQTDHKPLLAIIRKPYEALSPRLQRMVLRLQRYDFKLIYVPGKNQHVADYLSRNPEQTVTDTCDFEGESGIVHTIVTATTQKLQELKSATQKDPTLQMLREYLMKGWPRKISQVPKELYAFWHIKDELYEENGLLFKAHRLIVPKSFQKDFLQRLHVAHQGIVSCKEIAKESLYWPEMNKDITGMVQGCIQCQQYQPANKQDLLHPHDVPIRPWQKIAVDLFHLERKIFICAVDYFSKYVECQELQSSKSSQVINFLKSIFARHGVPEILISDNGPPFNSDVMKEFCRDWDTSHQTSSPNYPQSNGMIERSIQTVKGILYKSSKSGDDPYKALLRYRATPHQGLPSPSSLLMGREIRTDLPVSSETMTRRVDLKQARKTLLKNQNKQKNYANRTRRKLTPLQKDQPILYFKSHRNWQPAFVKEIGPEPNSYVIETNEGNIYRRNRTHLRPRKTTAAESTSRCSITPLYVPASTPSVTTTRSSVSTDNQQPPSKSTEFRSTKVATKTECGNTQTFTRSGRIVKPPNRLSYF